MLIKGLEDMFIHDSSDIYTSEKLHVHRQK